MVVDLERRLNSGQAHLEFEEKTGYLESLLRELKIPLSSQTLVFSKTSLQMQRISPKHPRALYFGNDVYVGMVRGGPLELAAVDADKGAVFYLLDQRKTAQPRFVRKNEECLNCHFSMNTDSIPGFLTRSVFVDPTGSEGCGDRSGRIRLQESAPLRWGGWYVTGTHGASRHLGNEIAKGSAHKIDVERGANVTDLKGRLDLSPYPVQSSDLVALMVLNHQVKMHNLITRLGCDARLDRPELPSTVERTLRYMLYADEPMLRDRAAGTSPFRAEFEAIGPRDAHGRSLRELDLERRLFRYPCSFLIYSDSFDALPGKAKELLYRRLWEVLSGQDQSPAYAALTTADRRAVLEILAATKPSLPAYFRVGL